MKDTRKVARLAILISLGAAIYFLENLIPFPVPVPGGRWGFSNMVLLISLPGASFTDILILSAGKNVLGSLVSGKIATPGFLMGLFGVSSSAALMWLMSRAKIFGLAGISVAGAAVNNLIQLSIAAFYVVREPGLLGLYPYFALTGSLSALINAYIAFKVLERVGDFHWRWK
ncbi:Gx transporter family protein [Kosmotoga pacifica]|uniref:Heptaprenyl diphosphate synthase n=1 Tax=Kosmotoga pacifica TaxID=1330330 RepID=A0A0G2Z4K2_9BACT|nr:Gx transporter family protein [Kosmotoga pacifica]AKI96540.1 heptaprenyl diphosphate synthase [Kosmotoga pacifica]